MRMLRNTPPLFCRQALLHQAGRFAPIDLSEMEGVRLLNRTDTKFILPLSALPSLLDALESDYRMLEIDENRLMAYETLYYDTPGLGLFQAHQTGRLNRYKVRQRHYVDSDLYFMEVKHKTNKGRTVKYRMENPAGRPLGESLRSNRVLDEESRCFVGVYTEVCPTELQAWLWVGYRRLTLVSRTSAERLTLDIDLSYQSPLHHSSLDGIVIAELKQEARQPSVFLALMKRLGYRKGSVSKYCLGMICLYQPLRHNRFKPQLLYIQKIANQR